MNTPLERAKGRTLKEINNVLPRKLAEKMLVLGHLPSLEKS